MSGYVSVIGPCWRCDAMFSMNPHKVPSVRINGVREPICKQCMDHLIAAEEKAGITPKRYADDAYDAIPEEDL